MLTNSLSACHLETRESVSSGALRSHLLNHLFKLLLFVLLQGFVVLHGRHVQLVLRLWLRWLKWTGENRNLSIHHFLRGEEDHREWWV